MSHEPFVSTVTSASAGRLPEDPVAFVKEAERLTNIADADGAASVYAPDAVLESITDGAHERHEGREAVHGAWRVYMDVLRSRGFRLEKRFLVAADGVIVNEWSGTIGSGEPTRGIEVWRFDDGGRVRAHTMYSFLTVKESTHLAMRVRLLLNYPRTALAFQRALTRRR